MTFADAYQQHGAIVAILAAFAFGVVASLTPCVYPMVPITVSIFGATEAKSRMRGAGLSAAFVLGIACLFTPMGLVSAFTGRLMGSQLSSVPVVVGLAILFTALSASMFGAFEIALPSSLTNRLSTVGGLGPKGAFAIGLVMGLVAAPCTGPFLTGMLVFVGQKHDLWLGGASLFAFALGLGVLFFVAGTFAVNLPKGGAWMMGIKWASGVMLAYMAFAYLRDRFEPIRRWVGHSTTFGFVAGVVLAIGIGLGILHVMAERRRSRLAPRSKLFKLLSIGPAVVGATLFISFLVVPPAISWTKDLGASRALAKQDHKPVVLDFGASWCPGCRELEKHTFANEDVKRELDRFVTVHPDLESADSDLMDQLERDYGVVGLPTVLVFDAEGREVRRYTDFEGPGPFADALRAVR